MKLGIIAGNRLLPVLLAQSIKKNIRDSYVAAICFRGETRPQICKYVDKTYWIKVGSLTALRETIKREGLKEWVMAGQINPLRIFRRRDWDKELSHLIEGIRDFRPHNIFAEIIRYLQAEGVVFLDSTVYLKEYLAQSGVMNGLSLNEQNNEDIEFGLKIISGFVELDVGQTIAVKKKSVVALESLEGTDRTIKRAGRLAGCGCTILKFSKAGQDLRFDIPVVGISTLKLLKKIRAASLVLEKEKVIILEKEKFLARAKKWNIPVVGKEKIKI